MMRRLLLALALLLIARAAGATTCTVPNTFVNGTVADGGQVTTNFSAILGCINNFGSAGLTVMGGDLILNGSNSGAITIHPQANSGTYSFNLPTTAGTSGQALLSGGGGLAPMTFGTLGVPAGGTGLASGISGGIPAFTGTTTLASSNLLTQHSLVIGGGAGAAPYTLGLLGVTTMVLHGNGTGDPTWGLVQNADMANSSLTIGSTSIALGATQTTVAGLTLTAPVLGVATGTSLMLGTGVLGTGAFAVNKNTVAPLSLPADTLAYFAPADATGMSVTFDSYGAGGKPNLRIRNARGTAAAPTAIQSGDHLGAVIWSGREATQYSAATGEIGADAAENWSDTAAGTELYFRVVPNTTVNQQTGMKIADDGSVLVNAAGSTAPTGGKKGAGTVNIAGIYYSQGTAVAGAMAKSLTNIAGPAGTASLAGDGVMMGLAAAITPVVTGNVMITVSGDITSNTVADGGMIHVRYGTGAAPANAGGLAGTTCGSLQRYVSSPTTVDKVPFSKTCYLTGAALSTALWIDVSLAAITGGTATIADVDVVATEIP